MTFGQHGATAAGPQDLPGEVSAVWANGLVRVTLGTDGVLSAITLDPRVKRLDVAAIADGVLQAVRAVQLERAARVSAAPDGEADDKEFGERLTQLQDAYARQREFYGNQLAEILRRMEAVR